MTDQPYPPLRPQPPVRRPRRAATPWAMIIGVVLLAILATALAAVLLGGGAGTAGESPTPSGSRVATASEGGEPTIGATASGSAASPSPGPVAVDDVVVTTVEGLLVRDAPGTAAERLGTLALGSLAFVAAGPNDTDGFPWYLVSGLGLPPNSGCAVELETDPFNCPIWFGWVAGANEVGDPWVATQEIECPVEPLTAESLVLARTSLERLACFGNAPFTFRGWWPTIPDDAGLGGSCVAEAHPVGWLVCQNINYNYVTINEDEAFGGVGARVSIDPATGLVMPDRGTWVEVRVHLDDPASQSCDDATADFDVPDYGPERYVLDCRVEMVLEAVQAVDGP